MTRRPSARSTSSNGPENLASRSRRRNRTPESGVSIVNATSETVTVVVLYPEPAGESELNVYRPGGSSVENRMINWESGCIPFTMVARTEDGVEIDRQPAPICIDEEWRIGD